MKMEEEKDVDLRKNLQTSLYMIVGTYILIVGTYNQDVGSYNHAWRCLPKNFCSPILDLNFVNLLTPIPWMKEEEEDADRRKKIFWKMPSCMIISAYILIVGTYNQDVGTCNHAWRHLPEAFFLILSLNFILNFIDLLAPVLWMKKEEEEDVGQRIKTFRKVPSCVFVGTFMHDCRHLQSWCRCLQSCMKTSSWRFFFFNFRFKFYWFINPYSVNEGGRRRCGLAKKIYFMNEGERKGHGTSIPWRKKTFRKALLCMK